MGWPLGEAEVVLMEQVGTISHGSPRAKETRTRQERGQALLLASPGRWGVLGDLSLSHRQPRFFCKWLADFDLGKLPLYSPCLGGTVSQGVVSWPEPGRWEAFSLDLGAWAEFLQCHPLRVSLEFLPAQSCLLTQSRAQLFA